MLEKDFLPRMKLITRMGKRTTENDADRTELSEFPYPIICLPELA